MLRISWTRLHWWRVVYPLRLETAVLLHVGVHPDLGRLMDVGVVHDGLSNARVDFVKRCEEVVWFVSEVSRSILGLHVVLWKILLILGVLLHVRLMHHLRFFVGEGGMHLRFFRHVLLMHVVIVRLFQIHVLGVLFQVGLLYGAHFHVFFFFLLLKDRRYVV